MLQKIPVWLRILAPVAVIIIWLVLGSIGGPTFGKINNVTNNSQASFLPASADSTKVQNIEQSFHLANTVPGLIILTAKQTLTASDVSKLGSLVGQIEHIKGVAGQHAAIVGPVLSRNRRAVEYIVQIENTAKIDTVVQNLHKVLSQHVPDSMMTYVTGPAGLAADLLNAFSGIDGILLVVALVAVFIILLLVYRSLILPFIVLLNAVFALSGAILLVYYLALHNVIKLNSESQGILSILVIGAATDYSLLLIARYREYLHHITSRYVAMVQAYRSVLGPVTASASTVILAMLCLLFSDLNSNRSLGPVAALGITFAYLAVMSFLPSVLVLLGRRAYWPFEPKLLSEDVVQSHKLAFWDKVSAWVAKRARLIWLISLLALLTAAFGLLQLKASGVSDAQTILGKSNAVSGQQVLEHYFPAGSGSPMIIVASVSNYSQVMSLLAQNKSVINPTVLTYDGQQPLNARTAKIVLVKNGQVLISATLTKSAESQAAQQVVSGLRMILAKDRLGVLVGGTSATMLDTNNTAKHDLYKIIPIVLVVILLILILLLRAIVGPLLLILSVILSFAATLGVSALVFNYVLHFPGADPSVPLFGFIFLVALGVDYNIFLMTRVREEASRFGTKKGVLKGLSVTGNVITSAGIILAATFTSLAVIPILFLAQIAFIVAFGVLLDTIIVRTLLVPSLTYDIGRWVWWPSKLSRKD